MIKYSSCILVLILELKNIAFVYLFEVEQARIQTTATFALANLENFVREKSGKRCEKSDKHLIKSGNFKEVNFFPVSVPL